MSPWVGTSIKRTEDLRLLTGRGTFTDDLRPVANLHHAAILRSPHAHARIRRIDASRALALPGVVAVFTGEDGAKMSAPFPVGVETPVKYFPIAIDKARFMGEPVAVVVARDRYVAEDAAALIEVDYEPLPAVLDPEKALEPGAPILHEDLGTNAAVHRVLSYGDVEGAFAEADVTLKHRFVFPKYGSTPMEGFAVIASYIPQTRDYTIWSNFQGPFSMVPVLAKAINADEQDLRMIVPADNGGGFGIKTSMYPYISLIALVARKAGVPVKWIEDRTEHLLASSSGTDRVSEIELAAQRDGTILGMRCKLIDNVGAYIRAPEPGCLFRPLGNQVGPYKLRNLSVDAWAAMTNKSLTGPNRGYGCQHLYFGTERMVDMLAERLGLDPAEVRRKNLIPTDQFPYTTPTGGVYDSGDYEAVYQKALELFDYPARREEQRQARAAGRLYGIGLVVAVDPSVSNMGYVTIAYEPKTRANPKFLPKAGSTETGMVTVDARGGVTVILNTVPEGQAHETVAAQLVADELGLKPEEIRVISDFDSASRVWSIATGTYSSRFASAGASAVLKAARNVRDKMIAITAHQLEVDTSDVEVADGRLFVRGAPDRGISFRRVAGLAHWNPNVLPKGMEPGLQSACVWNFDRSLPPDDQDRVNSSQTYGFTAEMMAVEVDRETGQVEIKKFVSVHDAGRIINPLIAEGQVHGAIIHGLGGALYEEMAYDENGQCITSTLMDYLWPSAMEQPKVEMAHVETPSPFNLTGAKGIGESSTMTVPVLVANAIADAIRPLGAEVDQLPLHPSRVWALLEGSDSPNGHENGVAAPVAAPVAVGADR